MAFFLLETGGKTLLENGASLLLERSPRKSVVRKGIDHTRGHGGYPPTTFNEGSPNVFCNGYAVVRFGDTIVPHCDGPCHGGTALANNASRVYVNGKRVQLNGDGVSCGDQSAEGSPNTFAG